MMLVRRSKRYLRKVKEMFSSFMSERDGPYQDDIELENVMDLINIFKKRIDAVVKKGSELNNRQKIFKQPITNFRTLR